MVFWVLLNPVVNVDIFVLAAWLGSGCKFKTRFSAQWFQYQLSFQSLCSVIWIYPMCASASGQSEIWVVICLLVQFSKSFTFWLTPYQYVHRSGVSPEINKQLYEVTFTSFSTTTITLILSTFLKELFFSLLARNVGLWLSWSAMDIHSSTHIWGQMVEIPTRGGEMAKYYHFGSTLNCRFHPQSTSTTCQSPPVVSMCILSRF